MKEVPQSLRMWFLVHFAVDILFGAPLLLAPIWFTDLLGFYILEPLLARLVGAALIGIGAASFLMHKKGIEVYDAMLTLKIIWSVSAIIALVISVVQGGPPITVLVLLIFIVFSLTWITYKIKIKN